MNIETIFYTQMISICGFVITVFILYRLLVSQKDSVIELLKQKNEYLERKLKDAENASPDMLVESLSKRVEAFLGEITRLKSEGEEYKGQILEIENDLEFTGDQLTKLNTLLSETELLCPKCQAPLLRRDSHTIFGDLNGREVETDIEFIEYECGYSLSDDKSEPLSECGECQTNQGQALNKD